MLLFDGFLAEIYTLVLPISAIRSRWVGRKPAVSTTARSSSHESIYGARAPLSVWHGTPLLDAGDSILDQRIADLGRQTVASCALDWAHSRHVLGPDSPSAAAWLDPGFVIRGWLFLYLFQGAVYYHLQVCVIIILLGDFGEASVALACGRCGRLVLGRHEPAQLVSGAGNAGNRAVCAGGTGLRIGSRTWRYLGAQPLWGIVGLGAALIGQAFYILISGNTNLEAFGSSLTSALLWYRWLPSATNPIGIIPGVLLVSVPAWLIIFWRYRQPAHSVHTLRWFALLAMLLILLVGGLIVSTKIGGGGDLHNMDAYLVLLAIIVAYFVSGREVGERDGRTRRPRRRRGTS